MDQPRIGLYLYNELGYKFQPNRLSKTINSNVGLFLTKPLYWMYFIVGLLHHILYMGYTAPIFCLNYLIMKLNLPNKCITYYMWHRLCKISTPVCAIHWFYCPILFSHFSTKMIAFKYKIEQYNRHVIIQSKKAGRDIIQKHGQKKWKNYRVTTHWETLSSIAHYGKLIIY